MGEGAVESARDPERQRHFVRRLLDDVRALETMLEDGRFETGIRRLGAEQELFLIDGAGRPLMAGPEILDAIDDPHFTTELARFNLEANLDPQVIGPGCLDALADQLETLVGLVRAAARAEGGDVLLCGILPTLEQGDLGPESMTPRKRYEELDDALRRLRGGDLHVHIRGRDELRLRHDNVMLEACNTSFQVHFQVDPDGFARHYNLAQLVTAPILAAATFSPVLFGQRLWHETRIALFRQAVDTRSSRGAWRSSPPRVQFGDRWIDDSILEIFREDIARFELMLTAELGEPSTEILARGQMPDLRALMLHNGTVYRWNRPCYGVADGVAHLRIENRVLPAGPSLADEVANTAFWIGLMCALDEQYGDVRERISFGAVKENFLVAARNGLDAQLRWLDGSVRPVSELVVDELLPLARHGLGSAGLPSEEIDPHLDIIMQRVARNRTGSRWVLNSLRSLDDGQSSRSEIMARLTHAMAARQDSGAPAHTWPVAAGKRASALELYSRVSTLMTTDLFTVNQDEVLDLVASIMDWRHIRHVPVEDNRHRLVGLITHRMLLRELARCHGKPHAPIAVGDVMARDVVTVTPQTPTLEAFELLRRHRFGSLPVVEDDRLVGIVTERDFLRLTAELLERL